MTLMDDPPPSAAHVIAALRARAAPRGRVLSRDLSGRRARRGGARTAGVRHVDRVSAHGRRSEPVPSTAVGRALGAPGGGAAGTVGARVRRRRVQRAARALGRGPAPRDAPAGARAGARLAGGSGRSGGRCAAVAAPACAAAAPVARDWSLVTCVVTPGFEYTDFELGRADVLLAGWPQAGALIAALT